MKTPKSKNSRREFLKKTAITATGAMIVPRFVLGNGYIAPSDKLNIAVVGPGGRAGGVMGEMVKGGQVNVVALCDVDSKKAARAFKKHSKAEKYTDFRKMLDKSHKDIDAVIVGTPDHSHAGPAIAAMQLGKHVYVEKPLAHTIEEARLLTNAAKQYGVTTQMGNQGASMEGVRLVTEWVNAGLIGDVNRVHIWTNRPIWPQGVPTPTETVPVPDELDWNLWQGPAKTRGYNPAFTHFKWRGWWDYGTGALGDMGCHILDTPFQALKLGYPTAAEASVTQSFISDFYEADFSESCPASSKVHIDFPARDGRPAVEMIWYDGGIRPARPEELGPTDQLGDWDGGCILEGSKGKIMTGMYGSNPVLLPRERMPEAEAVAKTIKRIDEGHYQNFVNGCLTGSETSSPFSYSGPLTETVLMGNLAVRAHEMRVLKKGAQPGGWNPYNYPGRIKLLWDGENMNVTNFDEANAFVRKEYRAGWELPKLNFQTPPVIPKPGKKNKKEIKE